MEEILERLGAFYACQILKDGKFFLLSAYGYNPFSEIPDNCIKIDAYYPASHRVYLTCRDFAAEIGGRVTNDISYKAAAYSTGEFLRGQNDLLIHRAYGSYFILNMIELEKPLEWPPVIFKETGDINCARCGRCQANCPSGAITPFGFKRISCLRDMADRMPEKNSFALLGDSLLGCEICRECCPYNAGIKKVPPPEELVRLAALDRILNFERETREGLSALIGSNMARASVLLPAAVAGVLRRRAWKYIPLVERLLEHGSEKVREAARLGMEFYKENA